MATTEIPPRKPFLPPPLYSAGEEIAATPRRRPLPDALPVPKFLVSLQDEIERSHRRQAFWTSVLVHLVALVVFINGAKLLPSNKIFVPTNTEVLHNRDYTFLVLPPDLQKNVRAPHTNFLSDKNRVATSPEPAVDHKALQHILVSRGIAASVKSHLTKSLLVPKPVVPKLLPVETETVPAPIRAGEPQMASVPAAPEVVPVLSAASASMAGSAPVTTRGDQSRAEGLKASGSPPASRSNVDIISDTRGVDFGPYLTHILREVRTNWFNRIPESARAPLMKKGKVSIQFDILKTGQIAAMQVVGTSGDPSLDGAALGGILGSGPFPPLPPQFQGQYLALRFHFFYNPDTGDLR